MTAPSKRGRFAGVEGLRAIAASSVLVYHAWMFSAPDGDPVEIGPLESIVGELQSGVTLFFALSGFLLFWPFAAAVAGGARPSMRAYLRNRALRILPAYFVVLALAAYLLRTTHVRTSEFATHLGPLDPQLLLQNALFLQNYTPATVHTGVGVAWSLAVEVVFYLVLPLLAALAFALARRLTTPRGRLLAMLAPVGLLLVVGLSGKAAATWIVPPLPDRAGFDGNWHSVIERSFWFHADLFAFGMLVAVARAQLDAGRLRLPVRWPLWAALGAAASAVFGMKILPYEGFAVYVQESFVALACALVIALVVLRTGPDAGRLGALLSRRALVLVGLASYSVFLWHEPLVFWLRREGLTLAGTSGLLFNVVALAAVTGVAATLTYRFVERPALRRKAGRVAPPRADPAAQAPAHAAP